MRPLVVVMPPLQQMYSVLAVLAVCKLLLSLICWVRLITTKWILSCSAFNKFNNVHVEVYHFLLFCSLSSDVQPEAVVYDKGVVFSLFCCLFVSLHGSLHLSALFSSRDICDSEPCLLCRSKMSYGTLGGQFVSYLLLEWELDIIRRKSSRPRWKTFCGVNGCWAITILKHCFGNKTSLIHLIQNCVYCIMVKWAMACWVHSSRRICCCALTCRRLGQPASVH